jgi:hypothetical protein
MQLLKASVLDHFLFSHLGKSMFSQPRRRLGSGSPPGTQHDDLGSIQRNSSQASANDIIVTSSITVFARISSIITANMHWHMQNMIGIWLLVQLFKLLNAGFLHAQVRSLVMPSAMFRRWQEDLLPLHFLPQVTSRQRLHTTAHRCHFTRLRLVSPAFCAFGGEDPSGSCRRCYFDR